MDSFFAQPLDYGFSQWKTGLEENSVPYLEFNESREHVPSHSNQEFDFDVMIKAEPETCSSSSVGMLNLPHGDMQWPGFDNDGSDDIKMSSASATVIPEPASPDASVDSGSESSSDEKKGQVESKKDRKNKKDVSDVYAREVARKRKHRMTDKDRRKRIKTGIDQLKDLVDMEPSQKSDRATIVFASVQMLRRLKAENENLKSKVKATPPPPSEEAKQAAQAAPLASLLFALGGSGVMMWTVGMDSRIKEVNTAFELNTGWQASEVIGRAQHDAPLCSNTFILTHPPAPDTLLSFAASGHDNGNFGAVPSLAERLKLPLGLMAAPRQSGRMIRYLMSQPPGQYVKAYHRFNMKNGDVLELIMTFTLVRGGKDNSPQYVMCLCTNEARNIVRVNHHHHRLTAAPPSPVSTMSSPSDSPNSTTSSPDSPLPLLVSMLN